jgi:hypothetical protein
VFYFFGSTGNYVENPIKPLLPQTPLAVVENGKIIIRKDYYTKSHEVKNKLRGTSCLLRVIIFSYNNFSVLHDCYWSFG